MSSTWSYWEIAPLFEEQDVVVIGAGIVGLNTAIAIKKINPDARVLVLERKFPGLGASTKNAGFACFGSPSEILDDINNNGEEEAYELIKYRWEGLQYLRELLSPEEMEFQQSGSFELFFKEDESLTEVMDHLFRIENIASSAIGKKSVFEQKSNEQFSTLSNRAIYSQYEGAINPLTMMYSLSSKARKMGIDILFGHKVIEIQENRVFLKSGAIITTSAIAICANGFSTHFVDVNEINCVRNQVLISNPIPNLNWNETFHLNKGYLYFRRYGNRLLIGGGRDLNPEKETTHEFGENPLIIEYLARLGKELIPSFKNLEFVHQWSGILGVGKSKKPIVQKISEGIFAGIRLGGMGIAIGSLVGKNLAELISNDVKMTA